MSKKFTCYSCTVRRRQPGTAGMDRFDEMRIHHATAPEVQVLLRLHGLGGVVDIQPNGSFEEMDDVTLSNILRTKYTRPDKAPGADVSPFGAVQEMIVAPIAQQKELPTELEATATGKVKVAKAKAEQQ